MSEVVVPYGTYEWSPVGKTILLTNVSKETAVIGKIIIPDSAKVSTPEYVVVSYGKGVNSDNEHGIRIGHRVIMEPKDVVKIEYHHKNYYIVEIDKVVAIVEYNLGSNV